MMDTNEYNTKDIELRTQQHEAEIQERRRQHEVEMRERKYNRRFRLAEVIVLVFGLVFSGASYFLQAKSHADTLAHGHAELLHHFQRDHAQISLERKQDVLEELVYLITDIKGEWNLKVQQMEREVNDPDLRKAKKAQFAREAWPVWFARLLRPVAMVQLEYGQCSVKERLRYGVGSKNKPKKKDDLRDASISCTLDVLLEHLEGANNRWEISQKEAEEPSGVALGVLDICEVLVAKCTDEVQQLQNRLAVMSSPEPNRSKDAAKLAE